MILPYTVRLVCLSLATFCVVYCVAAAIVAAGASRLLRMAGTLRPAVAARTMLVFRLLPPLLGCVTVGLLCVPSFLRFEPAGSAEPVGWICLTLAFFGLALANHAVRRTLRAVFVSRRYLTRDTIALVGILRPRLVVGDGIGKILSADQLAAAVRHEDAHRAAHDNLKRFLVLATPSIGLHMFEAAWRRFAEWAADDAAAAGDPAKALSLADALVQAARCGGKVPPPVIFSALLVGQDDLQARVERLLAQNRPTGDLPRSLQLTGMVSVLVATLLFAHPSALPVFHDILERLIHYRW